ncbi:MAG: GTP 3',8-cyclase MoaA, partial [Microthrixaceae bacterium]
IAAAQKAGLTPVKVNCVMIAGTNEDEILDFVRFARGADCDVRFIENMPLGAGSTWRSQQVLSSAEILRRINSSYPLAGLERGSEPAASYSFVDGSPGRIGVISSVTEPFCEQCDRLRLTSDGYLRTCLFAHTETDLRTPLRAGASRTELAQIICSAVALKGPGHVIGSPEFEQPVRLMSRIGG